MLELIKRASYLYVATTIRIGKVKRIATLRVSHQGLEKTFIMNVATVDRELRELSDYTLGSFSDSRYGTFYFEDRKEILLKQREGVFMRDFLKSLEEHDRNSLNALLEEYYKESYVCSF